MENLIEKTAAEIAEVDEDFNEEYETHNAGIVRKIDSLLRERKKFGDRKEKLKKSSSSSISDAVKRFRVTEKEKRVLKRFAEQSGYSENEVAYYFFAVGLKKEFEKERDKFDLSRKVKRAYTEALDFQLDKLREAVKTELAVTSRLTNEQLERTADSINELRRETVTNFQFIFWTLRKLIGLCGSLKFAAGKIWLAAQPDAKEFDGRAIQGYHQYAADVAREEEKDFTNDAAEFTKTLDENRQKNS